MRHLFGEHGIFAVGAYHASHENDPHGHTPITGYLLAMPLAFVPLAFLLYWVAVVSWSSEFWIIRLIFTIPFLICALLALIGLLAWVVMIFLVIGHVIAYVHKHYSKGSR